jgi:predicted ATP-grasp superfamily ATP-dependent carboligase
LDGLPCSAVFVADGRECRLLGISEQLIGEKAFGCGGFRYCGSILGPIGSGERDWNDLVDRTGQIVSAIAREFQLVGVNGMDFILKGGVVYPLEINPRYTASMELVERAYGINIFEVHLLACDGQLPDFELGAQASGEFLGKAILYAPEPLVFHDPATWFERGARDLPFDGDRIGRGKPVCTLFSRGATRAECYNRLVEAAAELYRASRGLLMFRRSG